MPYTKIAFVPGVFKDDSPLSMQGGYVDADGVRFVLGQAETIGGHENASTSTATGLTRGLFAWQDNTRYPWLGIGTHQRLYAMDLDGALTDITPATSYTSQQSVSLTTIISTSTVTVTTWTHGLIAGQKFKLENASVTTVGGVTVNGIYTVDSVTSATEFIFTAAETASSSAGPTASVVNITTFLAPGEADGLEGAGFGTGGFGSGGFGGSGTGLTLFPRTWSQDQWGQNLLASPRGGGLYEWAPYTAGTELTTDGTFSTASGWSVGPGWSIGAGTAQGSAGTGSTLSQTVVLTTGAWHLITVNVATVGAGSMVPVIDSMTVGASMSAAGNYRFPFFSAGGISQLRLLKNSTFSGRIDDVSLIVLPRAQLVTNAPTQIGSMFVTAERIVVACGSNLDGNFDALQADWSDAENNQQWTASSTNLAGGYTLPRGGRIVRGLPSGGENLLWTLTDLWSMRYNANPNSVFDFVRAGADCGLIGPNAAASVGGVWYWMTPSGSFFAYGGSTPQLIPCTLGRDLSDNLAYVQGDKVYASAVVGKNFSEIWWFYPDSRDGTECSRYVIYDTIGQTWSCGVMDRTAFMNAGIFSYPLAADSDGQIYFHEKGFSANGGPRSFSLTTAFNKAPQSDGIVINGVKPDGDDIQGGYTITFSSRHRDARGIFNRTYSALSCTASTGQKSIRVKGEMVKMEFSGTASPLFWRMGAIEFDAIGLARSR